MEFKTARGFILLIIADTMLAQNIGQLSPVLLLKVGDKCSSPLQIQITQVENVHLKGIIQNNINDTVTVLRDEEIKNKGIFECDPGMPLECSLLSGRCACKSGFTLSRNGTKCLEIARNGLESECQESIQCWKGLLGRLSECNQKTGKCSCYHSDTLPIVFHQGRCYYGESLGDFCQIEGLCEATTRNAECRGTCQCEEGYVGSWDKSRCLLIASQGLESPCEENVQCETSPLGALSQCNQEKMRCECYTIPMVPTLFHNSRCYFGAALGDVCQVDPQCQAVAPGSVCGKDGKCICGEGHVRSGNASLCLQIPSADGSSSGDSNCVEDIQCQRALGTLARCSPIHKKCECVGRDNETEFMLGNSLSSSSMVIIGGKCHWSKGLGQGCKFSRQCSARTENSFCYNGICECLESSHVPSSDFRKCLPIVKGGKEGEGADWSCDEDDQCRGGPLGPLSYCNPSSKRCGCGTMLPVVLYKGRCYFHRSLGSPCTGDRECEAGVSGGLSHCSNGTCQCTIKRDTNKYNSCTNNSIDRVASISLFLLNLIISMVTVCLKTL